jgi:hypothetical protein
LRLLDRPPCDRQREKGCLAREYGPTRENAERVHKYTIARKHRRSNAAIEHELHTNIYGIAKLSTIKRENTNVLPIKKSKVLAEDMGWTIERAEGYVEGERHRRRRLVLTEYQKVGIDEYALGFRAGYYKREEPVSAAQIPNISSLR